MIDLRWFEPAALDAAPPEFEGMAELRNAHSRLFDGDFASLTTARKIFAGAQSPEFRSFFCLAVEGGSVIGWAGLDFPLRENLSLAISFGSVAPEHRRRGVGTALLDASLDRVRAEGRTEVQFWGRLPLEALTISPEGSLPLPETSLRVRLDDPSVSFLTRHGATPGICERESAVDLQGNPTLDQFMTTTPAAAPEGYTLTTFAGPVPKGLLGPVADLLSSFSADLPSGELEWEEEVWTPERVQEMDAQTTARGITPVTSVVLEASTGRGAAYSRVTRQEQTPHRADQGITMVLKEHRGHGLGALVKRANTEFILREWPEVRRIYTDNADQNTHMLRINEAMGFRRSGVALGWKLPL